MYTNTERHTHKQRHTHTHTKITHKKKNVACYSGCPVRALAHSSATLTFPLYFIFILKKIKYRGKPPRTSHFPLRFYFYFIFIFSYLSIL